MAENPEDEATDETTVVPAPESGPESGPESAPESAPEPPPPASSRPRLRDTVYSFRAMIAVALATLLIGGAGGAALVALTHDDRDTIRIGRFGGPRFDGPRFDGPRMDGPRFRRVGPGFRNDGPRQVPEAPDGGATEKQAPGSAS